MKIKASLPMITTEELKQAMSHEHDADRVTMDIQDAREAKEPLLEAWEELIPAFHKIIDWVLKHSALTEQERANLIDSPARIASGFGEMVYTRDRMKVELKELLEKTFPAAGIGIPVIQGPIMASSLCPHHLLPMTSDVWMGYITEGQFVLGLSKFVRIAQLLAKRAVIQEQYVDDLVNALQEGTLGPDKLAEPVSNSVAVYVRARHMCMECRGVRSQSVTHTARFEGDFKQPEKMGLFLSVVNRG